MTESAGSPDRRTDAAESGRRGGCDAHLRGQRLWGGPLLVSGVADRHPLHLRLQPPHLAESLRMCFWGLPTTSPALTPTRPLAALLPTMGVFFFSPFCFTPPPNKKVQKNPSSSLRSPPRCGTSDLTRCFG